MGLGITPLSSLSLRLALSDYLSIYMSIYISTNILSLSPLNVVPGFNRNTIKNTVPTLLQNQYMLANYDISILTALPIAHC